MDPDDFSDDSLDDLPDNALQELENNAIQFTQAQLQKPPKQDRRQDEIEHIWVEDDDLDTTEVTDDTGVPVGRPVVDQALQQQQQQAARRSVPPVPNPQWNPTTNPTKMAEGAFSTRPRLPSIGPTNPSVFGSQRFSSQTAALNRPQGSHFAPAATPQARFTHSQQGQPHSGGPLSALQQRVRALEAELNIAKGEAYVLRSNHARAQQQHDAEVSRLKKLNEEQVSKQERILEAAVAAEKNATTELQFLQRDMREVNDRARRRDVGGGPGARATTPKKVAKSWGLADGFDEMEIAASPSKGQGRNRHAGSVATNVGERTPSKGKRKRPIVDSPVMPLEIDMGDAAAPEKEDPGPSMPQAPLIIAAPTLPFQFLQLVLDHSCFHNQPHTFDVFSRFSFPSDPGTSFSALIFQRLPLMGTPNSPIQLLIDFCGLIINMWGRSLDEGLWEPIKYLVSLISFTFQLQTTSVAPCVLADLIAVATATISSLAEGRHRLPDGDLSKSADYDFLQEHINTTHVLSLLYSVALACFTTLQETENGVESKAVDFWRHMSLDIVLLLLTPKQKLDDILGMLDLLATSSLPGSIGPIMVEKDPPFVAQLTIERVSIKLTDFPRYATTPAEKRSVRLTALRTLVAFAQHSFGAMQLASHNAALPRLVTCLSASLDELYDQPISVNLLSSFIEGDGEHKSKQGSESSMEELSRIISQCVSLIHTLVTGSDTSNIADIGQKLSMSHGGSQRYLLALGRLTFAEEDLVMEAGIDGEIVEAAHELLELAVTPDEGEIISEAFGA